MVRQKFLIQKFLIAVLIPMLFSWARADNVAVVVNTGDIGGFENAFNAMTSEAVKVYTEAGYRVIVLSVNDKKSPPSGENLKQTVGQLKNVADLRIDFIGHGMMTTIDDP